MNAQLTPGLWRAQHWTRHAATTVMVDDPDANTLGVRLVAECETEADARLMAAAKPMLDIIERLEEAFTRQGWRLDGHSPESAMLRDCRAALAIVRGSPT